jgi:putative ABC transport system permease protein
VELVVAALSLDHFAIPIAVDLRMVAFAAALALVVGLGIGLAPLLQLRLLDAASTFRGAVSRTTRSLRRGWAQRVLVAGEVASALVLLTAGVLLAKELHRLRYEVPGYDPRALYRLTLRFPDHVLKVPESQRAMASSLLDAVRGVPGVRLSALAAPDFIDFAVPPRLDSLNGDLQPIGVAVGPAYFRTTGTPIVRGRAFDERDRAGAPAVVIVDETAAVMYWPGEDPVGQRMVLRGDTPDSGQTAVVVGVAAPARLWITSVVAPKASPYVYRPIDQTWTQQRKMVASFARVDGSATTVLPLVRQALQRVSADAVDRDDVERVEGVLSDALEQHRVDTFALAGFAVFGLLLAAIGVYGSVALSVAQRTREVGIRLALGATRTEVLTRLTRGGMGPVCAGVAIGAYGAYVLTRLLDSFLIGTSVHDPWSFVVGAVVIVAVTLVASLVPARRAWKTDPAVALRAEV